MVAVKNVVLKLRPLLSGKKLLVSVAAGVKLKDLQVLNFTILAFLDFQVNEILFFELGVTSDAYTFADSFQI